VRIKFVAAARAELFAIASAYERKRDGLGESFLAEVERTLSYIKEYPLARRPLIGVSRRWRLSRYPYGLLYAVDCEVLYVLAVGHLRRNPKFWKMRSRRQRA
jgi:ParE toxin of type II toxin-antitoxin system, parDE